MTKDEALGLLVAVRPLLEFRVATSTSSSEAEALIAIKQLLEEYDYNRAMLKASGITARHLAFLENRLAYYYRIYSWHEQN